MRVLLDENLDWRLRLGHDGPAFAALRRGGAVAWCTSRKLRGMQLQSSRFERLRID